jgi:hypothetical protein
MWETISDLNVHVQAAKASDDTDFPRFCQKLGLDSFFWHLVYMLGMLLYEI